MSSKVLYKNHTYQGGKEQRCSVKTVALWSAGQIGQELGDGVKSYPWLICLQRGAKIGVEGVAAAS